MASSSTSPFSKGRVMATLTTIQHSSALVFGSFLIVHLAAPSVAVVASRGESLELATKTMILGRVYYQNIITEPLVVYASITVHVVASLSKKVVQIQQKHLRRKEDEPNIIEGHNIPDAKVSAESSDMPAKTKKRFSILSTLTVHTITGLILIPTISLHSYLNRVVPSSSEAPINQLSPSELDYTFVTYGFLTKSKGWRVITWGLYTLLLGAGAVHVVGGTDKISRRLRARKAMARTKKQAVLGSSSTASLPLSSSRADIKRYDVKKKAKRNAIINGAVSIAGIAWLSAGIYRMAMEDALGSSSSWTMKRLNACYASVWPYTLLK